MNLRELEQLVREGETEQVEFKRSTGQRTEGAKSVCAMLNGKLGGFVLFGVSPDGRITGQQVTAKTLEDVAHVLRDLEPPAFPDIETIALGNGLGVVLVRVPGNTGVFTYDGRPYLRHGPTTQVMPRDVYERRLLERMHGAARWENQPAHGLTVDDLDRTEIIRTVEEGIRQYRFEDPGTREVREVLTALGLICDGRLLNAAVVLFGKADRLLSNYPQCLLRMARFRGTDRSEFVDNRREVGNAFDLFVRAQRFMRDHMPVAGRIEPDAMIRTDEPAYPAVAWREALANALCHRDYSIVGGSVGVAMYDDRLEVTSTGVLPFGLKVDDLYGIHESRPWNPLIAGAFHRRGIIEAWGRGTLKMAQVARAADVAPPEFTCRAGEVTVTMRFREPISAYQRRMVALGSAEDTAQVAAQVEAERLQSAEDGLRSTLAEAGTVEVTAQVEPKQLESTLADARSAGAIGEAVVPQLESTQLESHAAQLKSPSKESQKALTDEVLGALVVGDMAKARLAAHLGQKVVSGQLHEVVRRLVAAGLIERTIPDKPNSRLQRYRLTDAGRAWLAERGRR